MKSNTFFKSKYALLLTAVFAFSSCTKLKENVVDEIVGASTSSPAGALAAAYDRLSKGNFVDHGGIFALNEYTTDEALLPTRGSDWGDGGKWRAMHEFTWASDNAVITDNWDNLTNGITRSLTAIREVTNSSIPEKDLYLAEAKGLLAFYTYYTLDLYGQAPYRDPFNDKAPLEVKLAGTGVDELITQVEALIPNLAGLKERATHNGRFTKEAAYGLLATMYLNRAVYKDRYNAAATFNFKEKAVNGNDTDMDRVIYYTSLLISSPKFRLSSNYFDSFSLTNSGAPELIWAITQKVDNVHNGSNSLAYIGVERNQRPTPVTRGTNAACMSPEFYDTWNGNHDDPRFSRKYRYADGTWFMNNQEGSVPASSVLGSDLWFHFNRGIMAGQQYGPKLNGTKYEMTADGRIKVSELVMEKSTSTKMNFTRELNFDDPTKAIFAQNQINRGVRVFKYEFDPSSGNNSSGVDMPLVRLGVMYTLRAEAYFRKGETGPAMADINSLRTSRTREELYASAPGTAITTLNEDILYREIAYETYWELQRRPQMIRFGKFEKAFSAKPVSLPTRRIFPIPRAVLDVSKEFNQNDGYTK